jgi:hypothetical protein
MCLTSIVISGICIIAVFGYFVLSRLQYLLFEGFYADRAPLKCTTRRQSRPGRSGRCSSLVCTDFPTITTTKRCSQPRRRIETSNCDELFVVDDYVKCSTPPPLALPSRASKKSRYLTSIPKEFTSTRATSSYVDGFDLAHSPYYYDDFVYKDVPEFYKTATHRRDISEGRARCRSSDYARSSARYVDANLMSGPFPGRVPFRQTAQICPEAIATKTTTGLGRKPLSTSNHNRRSFFGKCRFGGAGRSRINRMNRINSARVGSCEPDVRNLKAFSTSAISCPDNSEFKQIIIREKIKNSNQDF